MHISQLIQVTTLRECVGVERIIIFIVCEPITRYAISKKDYCYLVEFREAIRVTN